MDTTLVHNPESVALLRNALEQACDRPPEPRSWDELKHRWRTELTKAGRERKARLTTELNDMLRKTRIVRRGKTLTFAMHDYLDQLKARAFPREAPKAAVPGYPDGDPPPPLQQGAEDESDSDPLSRILLTATPAVATGHAHLIKAKSPVPECAARARNRRRDSRSLNLDLRRLPPAQHPTTEQRCRHERVDEHATLSEPEPLKDAGENGSESSHDGTDTEQAAMRTLKPAPPKPRGSHGWSRCRKARRKKYQTTRLPVDDPSPAETIPPAGPANEADKDFPTNPTQPARGRSDR
ncbi:hypothetical protein HPB51_008775 [Rhipicephalus microplus]|uniref:Uncharacterized protein n=1 Tax=Rhipicephalus microplus TaxID=6941 RepID=A0A9J6DLM0_RHIMP|nr:hypothetical protein HPB51_008775 [Rhipicephalus microplus]